MLLLYNNVSEGALYLLCQYLSNKRLGIVFKLAGILFFLSKTQLKYVFPFRLPRPKYPAAISSPMLYQITPSAFGHHVTNTLQF